MDDQRLTTANATEHEAPTGDHATVPPALCPEEVGRPKTRAKARAAFERGGEDLRLGLASLTKR